jgi:hypothetical protein
MTITAEGQQAWCEQLVERFRQRADAVKKRPMPPLEGSSRQQWIEETRQAYMDYAIIADAIASLENGILVMKVDLRPQAERETSDNIKGDDRGHI